MRTALVALALLTPLVPAVSPATAGDATPDPTTSGPLGFIREPYEFGPTPVATSGSGLDNRADYYADLNGSVHYPRTGAGPFPLVLFMHGRHATCVVDGVERIGTSNCYDLQHLLPRPVVNLVRAFNTDPIDSYRGYDYVAENLASHGYVVASVNANDVNDRDSGPDYGTVARAQILLRTIDRFVLLGSSTPTLPPEIAGALSAAPVPLARLLGRVDETRIGLMGHSRGGEGVTRAIALNEAGFDGKVRPISAVFALAPTDFNRPKGTNVEWATLLPICDGDVSDLWGARIFDDSRYAPETEPGSKTIFLAMGANHNWYNAVWWFDDAAWGHGSDPYCKPGAPTRLSVSNQMRHGLAVMGAFFRYHLGGETQFGPFLRGQADPPAGACPAGQPSCPTLLHVSYHPPAADRRVIESTTDASAITANDLGGATAMTGFARRTVCTPTACPGREIGRGPFIDVAWNALATYSTAIPASSGDVRAFDALTVRAGVGTDSFTPVNAALDFRIVLRDSAGRSASVAASSVADGLYYPPGSAKKIVLNEARVPLAAFAGLDLANVRGVDLVFGDRSASGSMLLTDLMFQNDVP